MFATVCVACSADPDGTTTLGSTGPSPTSETSTDEASATSTSSATTGADGSGTADTSTGGPAACECAPGTDVIHVLSDEGELWTYDPTTNAFALVGKIPCGDFAPFSMAVDRQGQAWILLLDNIPHATVDKGLFRVPIADASACEPVPYTEGLFGVFGMSFVANGPPDACERLYVHSYSGSGPFAEGPGLGSLGVLDEQTGVLDVVGSLNFDGGELAGTGDGRLFSFAGVGPVKLVELDKTTGAEITVLPLDAVSKTNASAMAFYGGDFYLFTESSNPDCSPCLEAGCGGELSACQAEPGCPQILECLLASGGDAPECQGDLPGAAGPLRDCLFASCIDDCSAAGVVSRVLHVDWDGSDGAGPAVTEVESFAPIRIVGAGSSTCVPVYVP